MRALQSLPSRHPSEFVETKRARAHSREYVFDAGCGSRQAGLLGSTPLASTNTASIVLLGQGLQARAGESVLAARKPSPPASSCSSSSSWSRYASETQETQKTTPGSQFFERSSGTAGVGGAHTSCTRSTYLFLCVTWHRFSLQCVEELGPRTYQPQFRQLHAQSVSLTIAMRSRDTRIGTLFGTESVKRLAPPLRQPHVPSRHK